MVCKKKSKKVCPYVIIGVIIFLATTCSAGAVPIEEWNRTFGGAYFDEANSVQKVPDGGYIILGWTNLWGTGEYGATWLIKIDAYGHEQWNRTYGANRVDKISPTSDGGYNLKGWSDQNLWIMEIDSKGNEKWNKTNSVDKPPFHVDKGKYQIYSHSFKETTDGGFIYAGFNALSESTSDWHMRVVRVDNSGNEQWNLTSRRSQGDIAESVQQTSDGGYIVSGATESGALVLKLDANGNQQWEKILGTKGQAWAVLQTSDSGYIILDNMNSDMSLIKMDATGNEQWNRTFGGPNGEFGLSLKKTSDDGYILAGYTKSFGAGDRDAWVIKTDASGNEQWNKTFGGEKRDEFYFVNETSRGDYILAGYTQSYGAGDRDAWVIRIKEPNASASETTVPDINKPVEKSTPGFEILGAMVSGVLLFHFMRKRT